MARARLFALYFAPSLMLVATPVLAGTNDILIGLEQKVTETPDGPVNGPPGKDEVLVMDVSTPAKPVIRARLPLSNALTGPPTNLGVTPDGKLGLITSALLHVPAGDGFATAPDERLFVIDLTATPPKLVDTLVVGKQPSGLAISHRGDLALVANRQGHSLSVLSIAGGKVSLVGEVLLEQEVVAVAFAPDDKRAFVCLDLANRIGVLAVDGLKVAYDKTMDIPAAFMPYNVEVTPDGKFVIAAGIGAGRNNADMVTVIDAGGPHLHVVGLAAVGAAPEGLAITPDSKWVVASSHRGLKQDDWRKIDTGELTLMSLNADTGAIAVVARAPLGGVPEALAFSPTGDYIYVGSFIARDLQVFHVGEGTLEPVGARLDLGGQPASMRGLPH